MSSEQWPINKISVFKHTSQGYFKIRFITLHFKTHSFRIGRATDLAAEGVNADTIKMMGRWSSNVFCKYIRQWTFISFTAKYSCYFVIAEVWIIGDSLVKHGGNYANQVGYGQLGQNSFKIVWLGQKGMRWEQLLPALQLHMITRGHPRMIIVHLGGNNIDSVPQINLMKTIREDLIYIHSVFSSTLLVWCDILPRQVWRNNINGDSKVLNLKCKRINRAAHQCMNEMSLGKVVTPHILWYMTELFSNDGVHLSEFGKLTYVQTFRNLIKNFKEDTCQ